MVHPSSARIRCSIELLPELLHFGVTFVGRQLSSTVTVNPPSGILNAKFIPDRGF